MTQRRCVTFLPCVSSPPVLMTSSNATNLCAVPSPKSPIAAISGRKRRACCLSVSNSANIQGLSNSSFARTFLQYFWRTCPVPFARMRRKVFTSANPISSLNSRIRKSCVFHTSWNATLPVRNRLCWSTMLYLDLYNCVVSSTGISFAHKCVVSVGCLTIYFIVPAGCVVQQEDTKHNGTPAGPRWAVALIIVRVLRIRASPGIQTVSPGWS